MKTLSLSNINQRFKEITDPLRAEVSIRATVLEQELKKGSVKPFSEVIKVTSGDGQAMGQVPITFIRQILALILCPSLLQHPDIPSDVKTRASILLEDCLGGSFGAYSESPGIRVVRLQVASFIEERDGFPSDWQNIMLFSGVTDGLRKILALFANTFDSDGRRAGVMTPVPRYPLYSDIFAEFGIAQVDYYLDEDRNWELELSELERSVKDARAEGIFPRVIVVINPGNPTGQVLSRKNIEDIIQFAYREKLFIIADEVYQGNIYAEGSSFFSFKRVLTEMGPPYSTMELASFMSCSKGYMGECGLRGGYAEVINLDSKVKEMLLKYHAVVCPTTLGQAGIYCTVNPPRPGEPSYEKFAKEKQDVLDSHKLRAKMVTEAFNDIEGISCNPVQGALYAFPQMKLPAKAVFKAKEAGQHPDVFYAFQLLEQTGICIVPGSGFGQKPGTFHFRTTILPQPEKLKDILTKFKQFHLKFVKEYSTVK